ncbi:MAG TPA: hypothetical protein PLP25_04600, partial [Candidatus Limiplasma sp.]|nr:hypothetical protein [Candidatus Limiplasma sp.]
TATLSRLLAEVEVTLIDHIIVAEQDALSMVRNGFIEQQVTQTGVIAHVANSDGEMRLAHRLKIDHLSATEDA